MAELLCPRCSRPLPPGATSCPACGQPIAQSGGFAQSGGDKGTKWVIFAVVGAGCLLVGLLVAGIVAALVIPNFLDAMQKAKQKRTLADMRSIGAALEAYAADSGGYPEAADTAVLIAQLAAHGYGGGSQDGWKNELRWSCLEQGDDGCDSYELASAGRDGVFASEPGDYEEGAFAVNEYDSDLVLANGLFVRWPESQGRFGAGSPEAD